MRRKLTPFPAILPFLLFPLLVGGCATTDDGPPPPVDEAPVIEELNDNFLDPELEVDSYVRRFEGESREIAKNRDGIVRALGLEPGMELADIGAGTGLFLESFSKGVGARGRVYAVDISEGFVEHMGERIREEGLENIEIVLCTEKDSRLPRRSVDVVFVCDTYHHFTYPLTTLSTLYRALRPGGKLVVVDFERIPGVTREWLMNHVRADKETFRREIEAAGFTFEEELEVDGLEENYVLRFRR